MRGESNVQEAIVPVLTELSTNELRFTTVDPGEPSVQSTSQLAALSTGAIPASASSAGFVRRRGMGAISVPENAGTSAPSPAKSSVSPPRKGGPLPGPRSKVYSPDDGSQAKMTGDGPPEIVTCPAFAQGVEDAPGDPHVLTEQGPATVVTHPFHGVAPSGWGKGSLVRVK
jgi:hypothetical protein